MTSSEAFIQVKNLFYIRASLQSSGYGKSGSIRDQNSFWDWISTFRRRKSQKDPWFPYLKSKDYRKNLYRAKLDKKGKNKKEIPKKRTSLKGILIKGL